MTETIKNWITTFDIPLLNNKLDNLAKNKLLQNEKYVKHYNIYFISADNYIYYKKVFGQDYKVLNLENIQCSNELREIESLITTLENTKQLYQYAIDATQAKLQHELKNTDFRSAIENTTIYISKGFDISIDKLEPIVKDMVSMKPFKLNS